MSIKTFQYENGPSIKVIIHIDEVQIVQTQLEKKSGSALTLEFVGNNIQLIEKMREWTQDYLIGASSCYCDLTFEQLTLHQRAVLSEVGKIPFGEVASYGEIASRLESSPRAVGTACGRNPFPFLIPCHRVVAKGSIGGFSPDLSIKKELLRFEEQLA